MKIRRDSLEMQAKEAQYIAIMEYRTDLCYNVEMVKGSSSKKKAATSEADGPIIKQEKPSLKKSGKIGSEIDEIFGRKKRKTTENGKAGHNGKLAKELKADTRASHNISKENKSKRKKATEENLFADSSSRKRKRTADGLTIYTEEELGIGKPDAGGTSLCPFDCDCCF